MEQRRHVAPARPLLKLSGPQFASDRLRPPTAIIDAASQARAGAHARVMRTGPSGVSSRVHALPVTGGRESRFPTQKSIVIGEWKPAGLYGGRWWRGLRVLGVGESTTRRITDPTFVPDPHDSPSRANRAAPHGSATLTGQTYTINVAESKKNAEDGRAKVVCMAHANVE